VWRVAAADGSITPEPIGSDPVQSGLTGEPGPTDAAAPAAATGGGEAGQQPNAASGDAASPTPPQTDIAPAVLPDGAVQDGPPQQGEPNPAPDAE
jgi:hypothetical protein